MKKADTKRGAERIRVEMSVRLENGSGVTRDVSKSGIFFFTDQAFSPGVSLSLVLELKYVFPGEPVQLCCRGRVVRVEEAAGRSGVAASFSECWNAA